MKLLNGSNKTLLVSALHLAAEQYEKDMETQKQANAPRLVEQFKRQTESAKRLAEEIENADEVFLR